MGEHSELRLGCVKYILPVRIHLAPPSSLAGWRLSGQIRAAAGITWWNFYFRLYPGAIHATEVIDFLGHLLRHLPGKLLVVWDGLPQHRAAGWRSSACPPTRRNSIR